MGPDAAGAGGAGAAEIRARSPKQPVPRTAHASRRPRNGSRVLWSRVIPDRYPFRDLAAAAIAWVRRRLSPPQRAPEPLPLRSGPRRRSALRAARPSRLPPGPSPRCTRAPPARAPRWRRPPPAPGAAPRRRRRARRAPRRWRARAPRRRRPGCGCCSRGRGTLATVGATAAPMTALMAPASAARSAASMVPSASATSTARSMAATTPASSAPNRARNAPISGLSSTLGFTHRALSQVEAPLKRDRPAGIPITGTAEATKARRKRRRHGVTSNTRSAEGTSGSAEGTVEAPKGTAEATKVRSNLAKVRRKRRGHGGSDKGTK